MSGRKADMQTTGDVRRSTDGGQRSFWTRRRIVIGVTFLSLLLRVWAAWQLPVDADEPVYLSVAYDYAQALHSGDLNAVIDYQENREHPPLNKLLYGLVIMILGQGVTWETALFLNRLVSAVFGALGVGLVACLDPLAGALLAVQTMVVKYTSQAYLEALPLCASIGAVLALARSRGQREGGTGLMNHDRWFWLSAIALGLAAAGKYSYFPILFVILYIALWEKRYSGISVLLYLGVAAVTFWVFDPALWHEPIPRLIDSIFFHAGYAQSSYVEQVGYPWYKPLTWVSRSMPFTWHPEVFFYLGFDGLIFLLGVGGVLLAWRQRRWVVVWIGMGMLFLLLWPTKWPQYTLVVLPAFCLSAAPITIYIYRWLREQEAYWDWLKNMFPMPSRRLLLFIGAFLVVLTIAAMANTIYIAVNSIGWSSISAYNTPLPSDTVYDILPLEDGRMVLATESGAVIWSPAASDELLDQWQVFTPGNSGLPHARVLAIAQHPPGVLWFGTHKGLARYDGVDWQVYRAEDFGLPGEQVQALAVDSQGRVWIGSDKGAAVLDGTAWLAFTVTDSGLVDDTIFALVAQPQAMGEVIWFGSLQGVSALDTSSGEWMSYTSRDFDLGWGGVADIMIDSSGRVWVATLGGGIGLWDGETWSYLRTSNSDLPYNTVQKIIETEQGVFWVGTSMPNKTGGVVARYDGVSWRIFTSNLSGYSGAETLAIARDAKGRVWFGTRTAGVDVFEP